MDIILSGGPANGVRLTVLNNIKEVAYKKGQPTEHLIYPYGNCRYRITNYRLEGLVMFEFIEETEPD